MDIDLRHDHQTSKEVVDSDILIIDPGYHDFGTDGYTKYCGMMNKWHRDVMDGWGYLYTPGNTYREGIQAIAYVKMGNIHTVIEDDLLNLIPMDNLFIQPCVYRHMYTFIGFIPYDENIPHFRISPDDELDEYGYTQFGIAINGCQMFVGVFTAKDEQRCKFKGNIYDRYGKRSFWQGVVMIPPFFIPSPWQDSLPDEDFKYGFTISIEE